MRILSKIIFILLFTTACSGPCLDEGEMWEEVNFHYMSLSTMTGAGNWSVSNMEILSQEKGGNENCISIAVVSGVYSNNSIAGAQAAKIFSDTLEIETKIVNDRVRSIISYYH